MAKVKLLIMFDDKGSITNKRICGGIYVFSREGWLLIYIDL